MNNETYPFKLPPLQYAYDALEPYIDAETMHYHHDKHFAAYIANLNAALEPFPALQTLTLTELLTRPLPGEARTAILRNGGGAYNHDFFFRHLAPGGREPEPSLQARITAKWGGLAQLRAAMTTAALGVFGSGWACLAARRSGELGIITLANQDTALNDPGGFTSMLALADVWEHAYYLKYKNDRADYLKALWNVLVFA